MHEKLYDIPIDSPLTPEKRDLISRYIVANSHLFPVPVTHSWQDDPAPVLELLTKPVTWEAHFHPERVEVFGSGPRWAAIMFTKKLRGQVREKIESVLQHAGFNTDSPAQA